MNPQPHRRPRIRDWDVAVLDRPAYHQHATHTRQCCDLNGPIYRLDLHAHAGADQGPAAWQAGDRTRAQQLLEAELLALRPQHRAEESCGLPWCRIWVVDAQSTDCLEFCAHAHRVRAQAGAPIWVLNPDLVRSWQVGRWPELVLHPSRLDSGSAWPRPEASTGVTTVPRCHCSSWKIPWPGPRAHVSHPPQRTATPRSWATWSPKPRGGALDRDRLRGDQHRNRPRHRVEHGLTLGPTRPPGPPHLHRPSPGHTPYQ